MITIKKRPALVAPVLMLLLVLLPACDSTNDTGDYTESEAFSLELPVQARTQFRLEAVNGTVDVVGVEGINVVRVSGQKRVRTGTRKEALEGLNELEIRLTETADEVYAKTVQPNFANGKVYTVDYTIEIPPGMNVELANVNGVIDLAGTKSSVSINLVNGDIQSSFALPSGGEFVANLVNGRIDIDIPMATSAVLTCSIANGTIDSDNLSFSSVSGSETTLHGTIGDGDGRITLTTVNGTIRVVGR